MDNESTWTSKEWHWLESPQELYLWDQFQSILLRTLTLFEVPELNRNAKTVGRLDTGQKIVLTLPSILLQLTTPRAMLPITLGSLVDTKTDSTDHKPTSGFTGDSYGTVQA